jgi:hypothetical protein
LAIKQLRWMELFALDMFYSWESCPLPFHGKNSNFTHDPTKTNKYFQGGPKTQTIPWHGLFITIISLALLNSTANIFTISLSVPNMIIKCVLTYIQHLGLLYISALGKQLDDQEM